MVFKSKRRNQITALLVMSALIVALVLPLASQPKPHFTDVPTTHWAYANIERAYSDGVMAGTGGNAAKYTGVFSPSGTLTEAQFVTIMTRGFFPSELEAAKKSVGSNAKWYAAAEKVAEDKHLLTFVQGKMDKPITRYDMAAIIANVMDAKEFAGRPDFNTVQATFSKIADINSIPDSYQTSVAAVFAMGIITGTDSKGTFSGSSYMNRAQAAVVYGRMKDAFLNYNGSSNPATPTTPTEPSTPSTPAGGESSVVGTVSSSPVTLSYATHKPTVDFWSKQSNTVKDATDKDAFNAAVNTLINAEKIAENSSGMRINPNFNYAVYAENETTPEKSEVTQALSSIFAYGTKFSTKKVDGCYVYNAYNISDAEVKAVSEATSKFTSSMSDKEKVKICVDLITKKFSYDENGSGFSWDRGGTSGVCDHFANATNDILGIAGIPVFMVSGDVSNGAHTWNQAYVDGEWVIVDSTAAEYGYSQYMSMSEHEKLYGYDNSKNNSLKAQVKRALVEAAASAR